MSTPTAIAIFGAGRMGQGIAVAFANAGLPVTLVDARQREAEASAAYVVRVQGELGDHLASSVAAGTLSAEQAQETLGRIAVTPLAAGQSALAAADVIFEGVPEELETKQAAFAHLDQVIRPDAIVASTTSTFLVTEVAPMISEPQRVVNAHWLNPADLIPLVEISRSDDTDQVAVDRLADLLRAAGKVPVVCGPTAGYIVPRIQALAMNEAARMVEEGVATAEDIDTAIRVGFGPRFATLGLLEFIDWGGGDILHYASRYLSEVLGERFEAPQIIADNMASGRTGMRAGEGFYSFDPAKVDDYRTEKLATLRRYLDGAGLVPEYGCAQSASEEAVTAASR